MAAVSPVNESSDCVLNFAIPTKNPIKIPISRLAKGIT